MSQQDDLVAAGRRLLTNNYRQAPIVFARGEGCTLFDVEGRRYLDMTAGIAVCVLGHGHPGLADAIAAQARRLLHVSNLYYSEQQLQLAEALFQRAFQGRVFFCNSGAEANEAALKLARRYQIVARGKARAHGDHRLRGQLPRAHHGRAQRHRPAEVPRRFRTAGDARPLRAVRRSRRRARRDHRADGAR